MSDQALHATPAQVMALAAAAQSAVPQAPHLQAERAQARTVARHAEVARMAGHHGAQVRALFGDRPMHAQFSFDGLQFGPQAFGTGQPQQHEIATPRLPGFHSQHLAGLAGARSHR